MSVPSWAMSARPERTDAAFLAMPSLRPAFRPTGGVPSRLIRIVCVLALTISSAATAFVPETRANAQVDARATNVVATTDLNLRAQPSTSSSILAVIPGGQSVTVTGSNQQNGFSPVLYSGLTGFAYADFLGTGTSGGGASSGASGGTSVLVSLNLRADASTSSQVVAVMPAGATVELLGTQRNGFVSVSYNGTEGWAFGQFLGSGGSAPSDGATDGGTTTGATGSAQTTTDLNLRSGAGTSFGVITVIPSGNQVQLLGSRQNNFAQLTYGGNQGWASLDFLTTGGGSTAPSAPADSGTENGAAGGATVNGSLNFRASASTSAQILTVLPDGAQIQVLGPRQSGFAQATYSGQQGWVFEDYITLGGTAPDPGTTPSPTTPAPSAPSTGTAPSGQVWATSSLNVRSGPGTTYSVLTVMPAGSSATATGQSQNGFWSLNYNGTVGWSSSSLLSTSDPGPADPVPTDPGSSNGSSSQDQIIQIIYDAADRYGQPRADMLRVARCESVLDPNAVNASGGSYGLFQFIPSTWATTPYASYDIFDPWASANAAGWMWQQGRRNEWVCQ